MKILENVIILSASFHAAYWNLIFGAVSILVLLTLNLSNSQKVILSYDNSELYSTKALISGVALLVSSLPLLLDCAVNLWNTYIFKDYNAIRIVRVCYTVATFLFGLQLTLQYDIFHIFPSYEASFWFMLGSYRIVIISTIMFFISITDPTNESSYPVIAISLSACFVALFHSLKFAKLYDASNFFILLYFIFSSAYVTRKFHQIWKKPTTFSHFIFVNLFFMILLSGFCMRLTFFFYFADVYASTMFYAFPFMSIYTFVAAAAVMTVIPGWVAHNETMAVKDQVIATKTAYQRYISHEMRSPLNATHMGIQYCLAKIPENTDNIELKEIRYALVESQNACDDGLTILNDLLLSDKIENGLVKLFKEVINVKKFMSEYLNMFAIQIRAKNINLEMKYECYSVEHDDKSNHNQCIKRHNNEWVSDNDSLFADKSKLGQVIRNLMSNAIKFTPNKGNIKICLKFVPSKDLSDTIKEVVSSANSTHQNQNKDEEGKYDNTAGKDTVPDDEDEDELKTRKRRKSITKKKISATNVNNTASDVMKRTTETEKINETLEQSGMLVIEVQDSGAGISFENQARLFKEIVQFSPEKLQAGGGSGLGLWISKSIVDLHGGRLSVHSEGEGKGSTFRLEIPMSRNNQVTTSAKGNSMPMSINSHNIDNSNQQVQGTSAAVIKKKFLLVDDVGTNRKFLRKLLELRGHICEEAEDGVEAVSLVKSGLVIAQCNTNTSNSAGTDIRANCYDAIFMDFMMPKMSGPDATRAIRELGYTGPIIGVTGNALDEDRSIFMKAGTTDVIIKPLKMNKLLEIVTL